MAFRKKLEEVVPLLDRLNENKESVFGLIKNNLEDMKGLLPKLKQWEETLTEEITKLERDISDDIIKKKPDNQIQVHKINDKLNFIVENLRCIERVIVQVLPPLDDREPRPAGEQQEPLENQAPKMSEYWVNFGVAALASPEMASFRRSYDILNHQQKICLLCFSIFPENFVIKKRTLIYWWIAEGFVAKNEDKTAYEVGDQVFGELIRKGMIKAVHNKKHPSVNSCRVHPWIRLMLIVAAIKARLFDFDSVGTPCIAASHVDSSGSRRACLVFGDSDPAKENLVTIFNVNEQYLNLSTDQFPKFKRLEVLQLGRWQTSAPLHIELGNAEFLNCLGVYQKKLKYLSLRGISGVTKLPDSIVELCYLEIMDLGACHNLQKLPSDIGPLKHLKFLDVSECYVLEGMPKGLDELHSLEVLKGFVLGSQAITPCKLGSLAKLTKLRKLSISIGSQVSDEGLELEKLKEIKNLRVLSISFPPELKKLKYLSFPPELEKLDLWHLPNWPRTINPSDLKKLKRLYVRRGNLKSIRKYIYEWEVEILVLKYLERFKFVLDETWLAEFPKLKYLQVVKCGELHEDFEWTTEEGMVGLKPKEALFSLCKEGSSHSLQPANSD